MKAIKFLLGSVLCICLLGLSSCKEEPVISEGYNYGIHQSSGTFDDLVKVEGYLKSKDCPMEAMVFTGKDVAETDKKAKAEFDKAAAKLSVEEIEALGLSSGCSFTYAAARYDENHDVVYAASYVYPQAK